MTKFRTAALTTVAAALLLSACGGAAQGDTAQSASTSSDTMTVQVTDNSGTHTIQVPPKSVVALDNRTFQTLADWDIKLTAASRALMPSTNPYKTDESIVDIGTHGEPNFEALVAAQPDLIINGQRFTQFTADITRLTPEAVQLNLDPRDGAAFDAELRRQTEILGQVFGKESEAAALVDAFDDAIADVKEAYTPGDTVMAVIVSGGNIGYVAPHVGRTLGPVFDILDLTPALQVEGSSEDHQGDDISVEAIAAANPDWILVMDRDAAISADDAQYTPAQQVLENSEALANVTAIKEGHVLYMPADTYTNEGIQTYTVFFNTLAKAFAGRD